MRSGPFLDTNIFLRHLLGDDPAQSPRATAYIQAIEQGRARARISDIVIFEVVFTLERGYRRSKAEIQSTVLPLIELPGIVLAGKRKFREVFRLYVEQNISFADAYHVVLMQSLRLRRIVSFDRDFNRVPTVERVEPDSMGELVV
jgi:predicted nucleic acid-binding protein